jgi:putative long chain acyl-CoA synthase
VARRLVADLVDTADGVAIPSGARFALGVIPAVDLVVAYGVPDGDAELLVAALTLRAGGTIETADIDKALDRLPAGQRPTYVQVVPSIPVTTWHRPQWRQLQSKGVPQPTRNRQVWKSGPDRAHYEPIK